LSPPLVSPRTNTLQKRGLSISFPVRKLTEERKLCEFALCEMLVPHHTQLAAVVFVSKLYNWASP